MHKVSLILFPGFQMLAYVLATETLRLANKCAGATLFSWETLSATRQPVSASNGALAAPDKTDWPQEPDADLVLLCAGYDPLAAVPQGVRAYLARAERAGAVLGGIDTGTVVLAELGFLNGHEAVLHYEAEPGFREAWPDIAISEQIYCLGPRRLTAAGGIATGDAMLAWIGAVHSPALAAAVSDAMAHGEIRAAGVPQRIRASSDPLLEEMHARMNSQLARPLPVAEIAAALGLSPKALRGRCRRGFGLTPQAYYLQLRLGKARDLLRNTEIPVTGVALATGFASPATFSRQFKSHFRETPRAARRR